MDCRARRGTVGLLVAFFLGVLLVAAAIAIDIGIARTRAAELQAGLDAVALAGASATQISITEVKQRAAEIASRTKFMGAPLAVSSIEVGNFDTANRSFTIDQDGRDVRVTHRVSVPMSFANLIGVSEIPLDLVSTARGAARPIDCGIVGKKEYKVGGGGEIDSYDSHGDSTLTDYSLSIANEDGNACSDGQGSVWGNPDVYGDATSGVGKKTAVGGDANVTGSTGSLSETIEMPGVCEITEGCADPNDSWPKNFDNGSTSAASYNKGKSWESIRDPKLKLSGKKTIWISPGVYSFSSIDVNSELRVHPPGDVELWVDGDVKLAGKGAINDHNPHHLKIIAKGDIDLSGGSDMYGLVYAMGSMELTGNSNFYGALVAEDELDLKGTGDIHLDESIAVDFKAYPGGPVILIE